MAPTHPSVRKIICALKDGQGNYLNVALNASIGFHAKHKGYSLWQEPVKVVVITGHRQHPLRLCSTVQEQGSLCLVTPQWVRSYLSDRLQTG
jgi:hypothetical protein